MKTDFVRELRKSPVVVWGTINNLLHDQTVMSELQRGCDRKWSVFYEKLDQF